MCKSSSRNWCFWIESMLQLVQLLINIIFILLPYFRVKIFVTYFQLYFKLIWIFWIFLINYFLIFLAKRVLLLLSWIHINKSCTFLQVYLCFHTVFGLHCATFVVHMTIRIVKKYGTNFILFLGLLITERSVQNLLRFSQGKTIKVTKKDHEAVCEYSM